MKQCNLKKFLSAIIILVFFMSSELLASQILTRYKGNEKLKYIGIENEDGSIGATSSEDKELTKVEREKFGKLLNDINEDKDLATERYVYEVGNTGARFSTNIMDSEKDTMVILEFGEKTYYKIWWDEIEYKPQKNEIVFGTLYLTTPGRYVVLVSNEDGKNFFNKYARYEFSIVGMVDVTNFETSIKKEGFACTYNESIEKYIYQYNDKKFLQSSIPFGYTSDDSVDIEFTSNFILKQIYHNGKEVYVNPLDEIRTKNFYEQGYYEIVGIYSSGNTETTEVKFNFEIGPNKTINDEIFALPSGLKLKKIYLDNKEIEPRFVNEQVLYLKEDGKYKLEYVIESPVTDSETGDLIEFIGDDGGTVLISTESETGDGRNKREEYKEDYNKSKNDEYQKYIEKVNLNQTIIKNTNSNLFHFDQELVDNSVVKKINIIAEKENIELKLYKAGLEIPYSSVVDEPGWYKVVATDKFGNKQETRFRISLSKANIINNILVVVVLLLVFMYLKKRRDRNYGNYF